MVERLGVDRGGGIRVGLRLGIRVGLGLGIGIRVGLGIRVSPLSTPKRSTNPVYRKEVVILYFIRKFTTRFFISEGERRFFEPINGPDQTVNDRNLIFCMECHMGVMFSATEVSFIFRPRSRDIGYPRSKNGKNFVPPNFNFSMGPLA